MPSLRHRGVTHNNFGNVISRIIKMFNSIIGFHGRDTDNPDENMRSPSTTWQSVPAARHPPFESQAVRPLLGRVSTGSVADSYDGGSFIFVCLGHISSN